MDRLTALDLATQDTRYNELSLQYIDDNESQTLAMNLTMYAYYVPKADVQNVMVQTSAEQKVTRSPLRCDVMSLKIIARVRRLPSMICNTALWARPRFGEQRLWRCLIGRSIVSSPPDPPSALSASLPSSNLVVLAKMLDKGGGGLSNSSCGGDDCATAGS